MTAANAIIECRLCPKRCKLAPGERGDCRARVNLDGQFTTLVYGKPCALHIDPIEKKPLHHFLPGTPIFSIAAAGCNLHCAFCQNWRISQTDPEDAENEAFSPEQIVQTAIDNRCPSIAYTYTEPIIYFEYTYDTSALARRRGLKNVLVTAGYIEPEPLEELCAVADAANVDLKSFSDRYYREVCAATLAPVLRTLEIMTKRGVLVEITTLIVPTLNDDMGMIREMCQWIKTTLGPDTPLHLSRFQPQYRLTALPPTPHGTLVEAAEIAVAEGLHYVYVGNLPDDRFAHTYCPNCKKAVIRRQGFRILESNLTDGKCAACGQAIHGVWR
ncbi:MAG: AmmeMemoRadiSam system radical SAM enzyme [Myxococcales bacterium]|nr:MAG: AmmeMemoRadiSam system radical SAM enzyme [Myxococcales bacterium]